MNDPLKDSICSKCGEDGYNCKCEQFHPNLPILIDINSLNLEEPTKEELKEIEEDEKETDFFFLTNNELVALQDYFLKRAGYISHEFDSVVLDVIKKIDDYLDKEK